MARIMEPTPEQEQGYREWVASRPDMVRAVAERFEPWSLYRMKPHGQRVTVVSFGEEEDGRVTLTVSVSGDFNLTMFDRQVFGVDPDDLEPCELPGEDVPVGAMMSPDQAWESMDELRLMVRPDLWTRDPNTGKAVRKQ